MSDLFELAQKLQDKQIRDRESVSFDQCAEIRSLGESYREGSNIGELEEDVADGPDIDPEEIAQRVKEYIVILTRTDSTEESHWASFFGRRYFSGQSISELNSEARHSEGEIREYIREYVGAKLNDADTDGIDLDIDLPDQPSVPEETSEALSNTVETLQSMEDDLLRYRKQVVELEESEFSLKWLMFLVSGFRQRLYQIYEEKGENAVLQLLSDLLKEKESREGILNQVDSHYFRDERKEIVEQAIQCHLNEWYGTSIPAALTQIDGTIIEVAVDLNIWDLDDDLTGMDVITKGEQGDEHISEIDEFFKDYYRRLMGRGAPRAKMLHGIRTDFVDDEHLSAKLIWMALNSFSVADRIRSEITISDRRLLNYLRASNPQSIDEIVVRFESHPLYIESRCEQLIDSGYAQDTANSKYTITDQGEIHLLEDLQW